MRVKLAPWKIKKGSFGFAFFAMIQKKIDIILTEVYREKNELLLQIKDIKKG